MIFTDAAAIHNRKQELIDWLYSKEHRAITEEQRHSDRESVEGVYWNYGYSVALHDVMRLIGEYETKLTRMRAALSELTYQSNGRYFVGIHGDTDVTNIVKPALLLNANKQP